MNNINKPFFTAGPVVTDDNGYLGYLWKGICFEDRKVSKKGCFIPIETDELFYTTEDAVQAIKVKYKSYKSKINKILKYLK